MSVGKVAALRAHAARPGAAIAAGLMLVATMLVIATMPARSQSTAAAAFAVQSGLGGDNSLYKIDMNTGNLTLVGDPGGAGYNNIEGLTFDTSGNLWAINAPGLAEQGLALLRLHTGTAAILQQVPLKNSDGTLITGPDPIKAAGLSVDCAGTMWITGAGKDPAFRVLYKVDPATGILTQIGATGARVPALASRGTDLFGITSQDPQADDLLVKLNTATGDASVEGGLQLNTVNSAGADFDESGVLWGIDEGDPTTAIPGKTFKVNTDPSNPATYGTAVKVADVAKGFTNLAIAGPAGCGGPSPSPSPSPTPTPGGAEQGYWMVASDGGVFAFGASEFFGSTGGVRLNQPIVGTAPTRNGRGYWMAAADGGIFAFGNADFLGSTGGTKLNQPIIGIAVTPTGAGYWLAARDGGIFAFGDASFHGSTGGLKLNSPIVGIAPTRTGEGYWLVAADGGVFAFGDAVFKGSTGGVKLNSPIVAMSAHRSDNGYWFTAADGGVFAFGASDFLGSTGGQKLNKPIVTMASTASGDGYWLIASDGGVFSFGDAKFLGSTGGIKLNQPIVAAARF